MDNQKKKARKRTKTSSFGSSGRESHDSTAFYSSKLYEKLSKEKKIEYKETSIPENIINKIFSNSSEAMDEVPSESVHLVVTSPPYNVGKDYDSNFTLKEYLNLLNTIWKEVKRVLVPGGRVCINVANLGRKPYIPLHSYIIHEMNKLNFLMRGEIIWDKSASAGSSTAWGSWMSPTNPTIRDVHEHIIVFSKESNMLIKSGKS